MEGKIIELQKEINKEISNYSFGSRPDSLYEPLQYIMSLGGKRIRPLLTLLAYGLFKPDMSRVLKQAIAVEVFHNFTLMHDDIMDNAPIRRGSPTVHEKWDSNTAILSGDVMMVKAYEMLMDTSPELVIPILSAFNICATEVCEGQQLDMEFEGRDNVTEQDYLEMIRLKTAVLLGFSAELGGILAGVDQEARENLRSFGVNIGIGFQLMDDLLDVYGDAKKFGKQEGGDIIANKKTFLLIEAFEKCDPEQKKILDYWIEEKSFDPAEKVREVKNVYNAVGIPEFTRQKMDTYFSHGMEMIDKIQVQDPEKELLRKFLQALINREQ